MIPKTIEDKIVRSEWVSITDCVWSGAACLLKTPHLNYYYPKYEVLFCEKLGVVNATLKNVVAEARQIETTDSLDYIQQMFKLLSQMAHPERAKYSEKCDAGYFNLQLYQIFPVWTEARGPKFDLMKTGPMTEHNLWCIADLPYLRESFEARVPLFAFETPSLEDIKLLIKDMGCEPRKLSSLVEKVVSIEGSQDLNASYTSSLRQKWKYIARCVALCLRPLILWPGY